MITVFPYYYFLPADKFACYVFQLFVSLRKALIIEMLCTSTFNMFNVQSPFRYVFRLRSCKSSSFFAWKRNLVRGLNRFEYIIIIRTRFMHVCDVWVLQVLYCHRTIDRMQTEKLTSNPFHSFLFRKCCSTKRRTLHVVHCLSRSQSMDWDLLVFCPGNRQHRTLNADDFWFAVV